MRVGKLYFPVLVSRSLIFRSLVFRSAASGQEGWRGKGLRIEARGKEPETKE